MQEAEMLLRYRKPCLWALRPNMPLKPLWNQQFCLVTIAASKITPLVSGMKEPFPSLLSKSGILEGISWAVLAWLQSGVGQALVV